MAGRRSKKRHRSQLSADEVEEIIEASKVPYKRHKDIAFEHRFSHTLIGRLIRESTRAPEKLKALR